MKKQQLKRHHRHSVLQAAATGVDSEGGEEVVSEIEEDLEVEVDHQVVVSEEDLQGAGSEVVEVDSVVVIEEVEVDSPAEEVIEEGVVETEDEVVS